MKSTNKLTAILIVIVILFLTALISSPLLGINTYVVRSSSMEPDIKTGSLILVDKLQYNEIYDKIDVGYDITYRLSDKTVITHRIISINEENDQIITRGVSNTNVETINSTMVIGKVVFVIPFIGYFLNIYFGMILILGIIFVYIALNLKKELIKISN